MVPARGLWVVILAAGGSRRYGRPKLLVRLGPQSLLQRAARLGLAVAGPRCVVVLGARAARLRAELRGLPVRLVVNRGWPAGMAGSLSAGIGALPRSAGGALVLLADQYALQLPDLRRLARAWQCDPARPVASEWAGAQGPPAILPRRLFPLLRTLGGDQGARAALRHPAARTRLLPMPAAAFDLDEPSGLRRGAGSRALSASRASRHP